MEEIFCAKCVSKTIEDSSCGLSFRPLLGKMYRIKVSQMFVYWTLWTLLLLKHGTGASGSGNQEFRISEGSSPRTYIGRIRGTGPFKIFSGSDSAYLDLNEGTGDIRVGSRPNFPLDRETKATLSFNAVDSASNPVVVTIIVTDINDNDPKFLKSTERVVISESAPPSMKSSLGTAVDPDLGRNSTQRYAIESGNTDGVFQLASKRANNGILYVDLVVNGTLDYEMQRQYNLVIVAYDGGTPPRSGSMLLTVDIQDANDNQPIFNTSQYSPRVMENATVGTSIVQVYATDVDSGENGHIQYHIDRDRSDQERVFTINPDSGEVHLNKKLDYEVKNLYELIVVARDNGSQPLETTARVSVKIDDVNDNPPIIDMVFLTEDRMPKVSETAEQEDLLARISISDPDVKDYSANVNVTLRGGGGHFALTTKDNVVYLMIVSNPLDRELDPEYTLTVFATDSGSPPLTTRKSFVLKVIDINDNRPLFLKSVYHATIKEVVLPGSSVIQVTANDRDVGNNSMISYSIVHSPGTHSDWFQIDEQSGLITTKAKVDCETLSQPIIMVMARDHGQPSLSSNTTVIVTILDVNDNQPIFDQSYYNSSVVENKPAGDCILRVSATDPDCGVNAQVTYKIDTNTGFQYPSEFKINNITGEVCIIQALDYEYRQTYEFPVIASDADGLHTTAMVKISVRDVNDNHPIFYPSQYKVNLVTNSQSGKELVAVQATDRDSGTNGVITYHIASGNSQGLFTIDPSSGLIKLQSSIGSQTTVHRLEISAVDGASLVSSSNAIVEVSVVSPDQLPPVFTSALYRFQVSEDDQPNDLHSIGSVKANNANSGSGTISYTIESGDPSGYFKIDSSTGAIKIKGTPDHEKHPYVLMSIQAQSGNPPSFGRAQVNITIEDVNDNAPQFAVSRMEIPVKENIGSNVAIYQAYAVDKDSGNNGKVRYRLKTNPDNIFRIEYKSGEIYVQGSLDYEVRRSYTLIVKAHDLGNIQQESEMTLVIAVQDMNDNSPRFAQKSFTFSVDEDIAVNTKFQQMVATDGDAGNNARIMYQLAEDNVKFGIFPEDGFLYVKQTLDRESKDQYSMQVVATDNGTPSKSASTSVTINILDVNDNAPKFMSSVYDFYVDENKHAGIEVNTLSASDRDFGSNGAVRYSFSEPSYDFEISSTTGKITTRRELDRERQDLYTLKVIAEDQGVPSHSTTVDVKIHVRDVNDNAPQFSHNGNYRVQVEEKKPKGTTVLQVTATDVDSGSNGRISYYLDDDSTSAPFVIDDQTGWITTREILDHKTRNKYVLTVVARDAGNPRRLSSRKVEVAVLDVGGPEFPTANMSFTVQENVLQGTKIGRISPKNSVPAGVISYYIIDGNFMGTFGISMNSGDIYTVREVDYEVSSFYLLTIRAKDTRIQYPRSTDIKVHIAVLDLNDNPPVFSRDPIVIPVPENSPPGRSIYMFSASDRDSGINGTIRYRIRSVSPNVNYFSLDPITGELKTKVEFDHEQLKELSLIIEASDQGPLETRHQTTITARVLIQDLNDNKPIFRSKPVVHVMEDEPINFPVLPVVATDLDAHDNGRVTYDIVKGNKNGHFMLDKITGLLSIARPLDHEHKKVYKLNITATDHGAVPNKAWQEVSVIVVDVNDNPPRFEHSIYTANVSESSSPGQYVVTVEATDEDTGSNAALFYLIPNGIADNKFKVHNKTGVVSTAKALDREDISSYIVTAYVRDDAYPARYDTTTIMINVLDVNDNTPVFMTQLYTLHVPEGSAFRGIHTVAATDADNGRNGEVRYFITGGNNDNKFILDATTGELSCSPLDRETVAMYNLTITARDNGDVPMSSVSHIVIFVLDLNDNKPQFSRPSYSRVLPEDVKMGDPVVTVSATDRDEGDNAKVSYSLGNDTDGMFTIDSQSGIITTTGLFDREKRGSYAFQVNATDAGPYGPRTESVWVYVTVSDINDNPPVFEKIPYFKQIWQNHTLGKPVLQVKAVDADKGDNAVIMYSMSTSNYFTLDQTTGEVKTSRALDSNAIGYHTLDIIARDRGTPQLSSQGVVKIQVGSPSGPILQFQQGVYNVSLSEVSPQYTIVTQVNAEGSGGQIKYSIASGNEDGTFMIDINSGLIEVNNPHQLDYETKPLIRLTAMAEIANMKAFATVWINLKDGNDNAPKFTQKNYVSAVWEGSASGTYVTQVSANDPDQGRNGDIQYSIINGNDDSAFQLNSKLSGVVKTKIVLDREIRSSYQLEIEAVDLGNPQLSSTCTLRITVVDVNDNSPFFPPPAPIYVSEATKIGSVITTITANDVDVNPTLIYSFMANSNAEGTFSIDHFSGRITLAKPLDHEKRTQFKLQIKASDVKHSATTTMLVNVEDENDNTPKFTQETYEVSLDELTRAGHPVLTVNATDVDSGQNAEIEYGMVLPSVDFYINKRTGTIYTNKTVVFNQAQPTAQLVVKATDGAKQPRTAIAAVLIQIVDVNNNAPVFTKSVYTVHLDENAPTGKSVITVVANDADHARNNRKVDYTILSGNEAGKFQMVSNTGEIFLASELDRESVSQYSITVRGQDRGKPPQESTATVNVIIDDINDWAPAFLQSEYFAVLNESIAVGSRVVQISASDNDEGENAVIEYAITSGDDDHMFTISPQSGWITVQKPLDHEQKSLHRLVVRAMDCIMCSRQHRLANYTTVTINISDINDHQPSFPVLMYIESVKENAEIGTTVFVARASDQDGGIFGRLEYEILEAKNLFRINRHSGSVTTNAIFDYETTNEYRFKIRATDTGGNTVVIPALVNIESVDEFPPKFENDKYKFSVPGNAEVGDVVGQVQASDQDGGEDGVVVFTIDEPNDYFEINRTSGVITVKRLFNDKRRRKRYVNRYTERTIMSRSRRALEDSVVTLLIKAGSGKQDSLSDVAVIECMVDRSCPGCGIVGPTNGSGLSGTMLVLVIVFAVIIVIVVVVVGLLCFRKRKAKRCPPPLHHISDGSFDQVHVHEVHISPNIAPLTAREEPPRYTDVLHYQSNSTTNITTPEISDQSHSASSGRGSAEDNEDDDEEIRIINSAPYNQSMSLQRKGMPDSGIQQDDDNVSEHSIRNHRDYLAKLGIDVTKINTDNKPAGLTQSVESMHQFSEEGGGEGDGLDIGNIIYSKLGELDSEDDLSSMMTVSQELAFDDVAEPSHAGSLSSVINSEEEFSGSYNWDYLLDWGPQYQPLADVFTEIARLKDENIQPKKQPTQIIPQKPVMHSSGTKIKMYPPPMLTDMPPVPSLPPSIHSSQSNSTVSPVSNGPRPNNNNSTVPILPRSPITHDASFQSHAYTPSFTPSLSPLGMRNPTVPGYNMGQRGTSAHTSGLAAGVPSHSTPSRTRTAKAVGLSSSKDQEFRI